MPSTVCTPIKFAVLCGRLNQQQKDAVHQLGLGSLLSIPAMPIQRILLETIAEKYDEVVIQLKLNVLEEAVNLDEKTGDCSNKGGNLNEEIISDDIKDGVDNEYYNDDSGDKTNKDNINMDESQYGNKSDESDSKDTLKTIMGIVERNYAEVNGRFKVIEDSTKLIPEAFAMLQGIMKKLDDKSGSTTCVDKKSSEKLFQPKENVERKKNKVSKGNSSNVSKGQGKREPVIDHGMGNSGETSKCDGVKRKHDENCSPTLVEKVKTRTDRQPSKICISPYQCINLKRLFERPTNGAHLDDVTGGLDLSALEVAAVKFVPKELALDTDNVIVSIGESELRGSILRSLVRPTREDGTEKWLNAQIINSYATIFNSVGKGTGQNEACNSSLSF